MSSYHLTYVSRRGAHIAHHFADFDEAVAKLKTLKCEARLVNDNGDWLGCVERSNGRCDDRRVQWLWWAALTPADAEPQS